MFCGGELLEKSVRPGDFAAEIRRTNDKYSFESLLGLFSFCRLVRSRDIEGSDTKIPFIREILLQKFSVEGIRNLVSDESRTSSSSKCSVPSYKQDLIRNAEPSIEEEPKKPWITLKKNAQKIKYLPSLVDISFKARYVYVDVGARSYGSSIVSWFKKQYPKQKFISLEKVEFMYINGGKGSSLGVGVEAPPVPPFEIMNRSRNFLQHFNKCSIILVILCLSDDGFCLETDTINTTLVLRDPETIHSSARQFILGFFTPNGTARRYMGIWYYASPSSVAWVANRENPLNDSRGSISISANGNLVLLDGENQVVWETNASSSPSNLTIAQLLDSGNLVLKDTSSSGTLWESHRHPVDSFLPGMKVSHNPKTGARVGMSSWRSFDDPAWGNFTAGLDAVGIPQIYIWESGVPRWRSGPWDGRVLTGVTGMFSSQYRYGLTLEIEDDDTYYFTRNSRPGYILRNFLNAYGVLVEAVWEEQRNQWNVTWTTPANECDFYNKCGPNSVCYVHGNPICSCLRGYVPGNGEDWNRGTWSGGCVRRSLLQCERDENATDKNREDKFSRLTFIKVPDHMLWTSGLETDCSPLCLRNCSCLAYAFIAGTGCMFWSGDFIDIQQFAGDAGSDFFVRVSYWEVDQVKRKSKLVVTVVSVIACLVALSVCLFLSWWICKRKRKNKKSSHGRGDKGRLDSKEMDKIEELPLFSFVMLATATNQFALSNKLGAGGFGPVYKGKLENGTEIAVKRLSAASGQGYEEFMNEVLVISKLQHRNLVRLFGCCVEREEKMLVYEFLPNGSLDVLLFDTTQEVLDWKKRFNIIKGIGRGLLYLHRDSRLKIIHRDLKPSNILLDQDWKPKVSDFGMAKIFGGNQDQANTGKVVGTYGYMAPEYALGGRFSEKSDVFSFGVVVLEIISGRKNTSFYNDEFSLGLLGYAWKLWNEENVEDLIDTRISRQSAMSEIIRCLHVGLLCVQEYPVIRPTMSMVLSMLSSEIADHLPPEHPGFTERWSRSHVGPASPAEAGSVNCLTQTAIEGR